MMQTLISIIFTSPTGMVSSWLLDHGPLTDAQNCGLCMRRECWERFSRHQLQKKPLISDLGMHHGTCVTHVPWCMSGSLTSGGGENVPGIPGACATRNFAYLARGPLQNNNADYMYIKYSLLMHCIKIKSPVKFLLNEQYVFVGGNISFLCVLSCSSEEA